MAIRIFLLLATSYLLCLSIGPTEAASEDLVTFPYSQNPCKCELLKCKCCQGIVVSPINLEKTLCLHYTLSLITLKVEFKIVLDNTIMAEFSINSLAPPNYCIPVPVPNSVGMCVKIKISLMLAGAVKVCSTFYVNYQTEQVFDYQFPCMRLGTSGISLMRK